MSKKFLMIGGPGDGKTVELDYPFGQFQLEEDGVVRHGPSNGDRYDLRRVPWPYADIWFAVHESLWKGNVLAVWATDAMKKAYNELLE